MIRRMTPKQLVALTTRRLRDAGSPDRARGALAYFKSPEGIALHGVSVPEARGIAKELYALVRDTWTTDDAIVFCDRCVHRPEMETKWVGFWTLGRFEKTFSRALLTTVKKWIAANLCNNWALIDALCPAVLTPLMRRHPALIPAVESWSGSPNMWLRRAAVVTFVSLARKGEQLEAAYGVVESLLDDGEDLIHKACGWLLREAGKTDSARLERFLRAHGPRIPRTTVRYAIERMPAARRAALLRQTRAVRHTVAWGE